MRNGFTPALSICAFSLALLAAEGLPAAEGVGAVYDQNPIVDANVQTVRLSGLDGTGHLAGIAAVVTNSMIDRAYSADLDFTFDPELDTASRIHFAETMAYHHVTRMYEYVRGLGFHQVSAPVHVTVFNARQMGHSWIPIPTRYDDVTGSISLAATIDGQDSDALDADIILHEYTHAVQHQLLGGVPGAFACYVTSLTEQAGALMEGLADYASCSRVGGPREGEWHGAIWREQAFLRSVENFRRWPGDFVDGGAHATGMIFAGAMWDLRASVGRTVADTLALETIRTVADNDPGTPELNTTFEDALGALLQADQALYAGAHEASIRQALAVHGLGSYDFSTPYPMMRDPGNNCDDLKTYSDPDAEALAVLFDEFVTKLDDSEFTTNEQPLLGYDTKDTVDQLVILDGDGNVVGTFTGRELQGATVIVPGNTVRLHLMTDAYLPPFGYRVVDIKPLLKGDATLDGNVDYRDYVMFKAKAGQYEGMTWADGDFDFDGDVDRDDFAWLKVNFGRSPGGDSSVPEPSSGVMVMVAGVAVRLCLRRRTAGDVKGRRGGRKGA